jgi:hypothetical protein
MSPDKLVYMANLPAKAPVQRRPASPSILRSSGTRACVRRSSPISMPAEPASIRPFAPRWRSCRDRFRRPRDRRPGETNADRTNDEGWRDLSSSSQLPRVYCARNGVAAFVPTEPSAETGADDGPDRPGKLTGRRSRLTNE